MIGNLLAPFRLIPDLLIRFIEDDGLAYIGLMSLLPFLVFVFTLLGSLVRPIRERASSI